MKLKHYDRYLRQMLSHGHGLALWEPEPDQTYDKVEIADVGYTQRGHFLRLFNCSLPIGDLRNKLGVPEGYEPLRLDPTSNTVESLQAQQPLWSSDVKVVRSSLHVSPQMPTVGAGVGFQANIQTSSGSGAMLFTGQEMRAQDAPETLHFENYIKKNHDSWLTFARNHGRKVELEDLILVTGRHLTADFVMFSFSEANRDAEIGFDLGFPSIASGSFSLSFSSTHITSPAINSGPRPRPAPTPDFPMIGIEDETDAQSISDCFTQCVFLRGYRVKKRKMRFPKVIKAAAGPHDLGPGEHFERYLEPLRAESNSDSSSDDLEFVSDTGPALDPTHPLLQYILANSEVSLALVHDDDLGQLYKKFSIEPHMDLNDSILRMNPKIEVYEGVGRLALSDCSSDNLTTEPAMTPEVSSSLTSVGQSPHMSPNRLTSISQRPISKTYPLEATSPLVSDKKANLETSRSVSPSTSPENSLKIFNNNATSTFVHAVHAIPMDEDRARYIRQPTPADRRAPGWRQGYLKCVFEGCPRPYIHPWVVIDHLANHIHAGNRLECTCGASFSGATESDQHLANLADLSPCERCHETRTKRRGTLICTRCAGPVLGNQNF